MGAENVFRTFCHISEYGTEGYAHLHRMIAASAPVVLWAPSSVLIASPACRVSAKEFVTLLDKGVVRVIGRENWIMSRAFRDSHRWPGARWTPRIDDAIKAIATNDELLPLDRRRVALAEGERGEIWAYEHIEQNPDLVGRIYGALSAPNAAQHFPPGVVETALAAADNPVEIVRRVVRDAYNHDAAIAQSGTRTPFLLAPRETQFHKLLESIRAASDINFPDQVDVPMLNPDELSELASEVLRVLQHLECGRPTGLGRFVRSGGHALLAAWMKQVSDSLARTDARNVRGEVISRLRQEFDSEDVKNDWSDLFLKPDSLIGSVGTGAGAVEAIASELTIYGAIGLATGAYAIGHSLAQKLGYAASAYDGPQWAFIYAFGRQASGRRRKKLQLVLDRLAPE